MVSKTFSLEKILYLSHQGGAKGFHVAKNEHKRGTDVSRLVKNAHKRGELTVVVKADGDEHYHITPLGEMRLLEIQIAFRAQQGKDIDGHLRKMMSLFVPDLSDDARQLALTAMDEAGKAGLVFDQKNRPRVLGSLSRMGVIKPVVDGDKDGAWRLTAEVGVPFREAFRSAIAPSTAYQLLKSDALSIVRRRTHEECLKLRDQIVTDFGGTLTPEQMISRFEKAAKDMGFSMDPALATHYVKECGKVRARLIVPEAAAEAAISQPQPSDGVGEKPALADPPASAHRRGVRPK